MAFCTKCGHQLADGAKFCFECGAKVDGMHSAQSEQRKTVYDGEIHKCPNCGEVLAAFAAVCPTCGYELRGAMSSEMIRAFSVKLEHAKLPEEKTTIIRSFPIPNTKEDIIEFVVLASSNIIGEDSKAVFNAWQAKFEQCYQKAKLSFGNDKDFIKVQNIYDQTNKQIARERAVHGVNRAGNVISKFTATFPNPVFGIVVVLLGIYEVIRIVKGDFAGLDIIMVALILWCTYKITNRKRKKDN